MERKGGRGKERMEGEIEGRREGERGKMEEEEKEGRGSKRRRKA